jgi:hypothetical protein
MFLKMYFMLSGSLVRWTILISIYFMNNFISQIHNNLLKPLFISFFRNLLNLLTITILLIFLTFITPITITSS